MATCDVCGNEYDKAFQVVRGEESPTFDSFECAHCAQGSGVTTVADRAG